MVDYSCSDEEYVEISKKCGENNKKMAELEKHANFEQYDDP